MICKGKMLIFKDKRRYYWFKQFRALDSRNMINLSDQTYVYNHTDRRN